MSLFMKKGIIIKRVAISFVQNVTKCYMWQWVILIQWGRYIEGHKFSHKECLIVFIKNICQFFYFSVANVSRITRPFLNSRDQPAFIPRKRTKVVELESLGRQNTKSFCGRIFL